MCTGHFDFYTLHCLFTAHTQPETDTVTYNPVSTVSTTVQKQWSVNDQSTTVQQWSVQ